jgi:elongation factor 1-alpha
MGDNLAKPSENMKWWKGPTLLQALNNLKVPEKPTKLPLRVPVQDVYTISGVGTVPVGRVECGIMRKDDKIIFEPANVAGEVKSIEMHHEEVPEAQPGDNIGWNVRGVGKKDIRRGDVCGHTDKPPMVAKEFKALLYSTAIRHRSLAPSLPFWPSLIQKRAVLRSRIRPSSSQEMRPSSWSLPASQWS